MSRALAIAAAVPTLLVFAAPVSHSQSSSSASVRIVVPLAKGGRVDLAARAIAPALGNQGGPEVIVENIPGGEPFGIRGMEAMKKASADGRTLLMTNLDIQVLMPTMQSNLPYDPVRDFSAVSQILSSPQVLVTAPASKIYSVQDLISRAKSGSVGFVSGGNRGPQSWSGHLLRSATGLNVVHVPQVGGIVPVIKALISGEGEIAFLDYGTAGRLLRGGRLTPLAVAGTSRHAKLPDVPTLLESGIQGVEVDNWVGVLVPAGTPEAVVKEIHGALSKVIALPDVRNDLDKLDYLPISSTPGEFADMLARERARWARVYRDMHGSR